jgi:hypothetical protein
MAMKAIKFSLVALVIAASAGPSFARTREQAIQDCSAVTAGYTSHVWGSSENVTYRSCMIRQGYEE